jgi:transketolase
MFDRKLCEQMATEIRTRTVRAIGHLGVGHIGGCLSIAEVLSVLYYAVMRIDPLNPKMQGRDRLILSKGHAGPALYAVLSMKGYIGEEELLTLNQLGTNLPSHCDMNRTNGVDMTTGSLGQGFSCAVGIAIGSKLRCDGARIYAIIGDGESQEGQIWEAAMFAAARKLDNLIAFTDLNGLQIDGETERVNSLGDIEAKWAAFGWHTQRVDGHDAGAIHRAVELAQEAEGQPHMILLNTVKGRGVGFIERMGATNHNAPLSQEQTRSALTELEQGG